MAISLQEYLKHNLKQRLQLYIDSFDYPAVLNKNFPDIDRKLFENLSHHEFLYHQIETWFKFVRQDITLLDALPKETPDYEEFCTSYILNVLICIAKISDITTDEQLNSLINTHTNKLLQLLEMELTGVFFKKALTLYVTMTCFIARKLGDSDATSVL